MPSGLVKDQDDVLVLADRCGELIKELLHRLGVGVWQHEREGVVGAGLDRRENVGESEALVAQAWRTLAALPPDAAHATLLADAGLVLEEQAQALVFMRMLKFFEELRGSFLKASCEAGSFCGWLGRAFCRDRPMLRSKRPIVARCMVLSNRFSQIRTRSSRVNAQTPSISGSGPAITMA